MKYGETVHIRQRDLPRSSQQVIDTTHHCLDHSFISNSKSKALIRLTGMSASTTIALIWRSPLPHKDAHNKLLLFRQFRKRLRWIPSVRAGCSATAQPIICTNSSALWIRAALLSRINRLQPMEDSSVTRPGTAKQSRWYPSANSAVIRGTSLCGRLHHNGSITHTRHNTVAADEIMLVRIRPGKNSVSSPPCASMSMAVFRWTYG